MIHDIIPLPIQIPDGTNVAMTMPLWLHDDILCRSGSENIHQTSRDIKSGNMYRYKIIELGMCSVTEHMFVSFDELNTRTLGLMGKCNTPIDLYPISTKVVPHEPERQVSAYRHLNGICAAISKSVGCPVDELDSVHRMFLRCVGSGVWRHERLELANAYRAYLDNVESRMGALVTSDEEASNLLVTQLDEINYLMEKDICVTADPEFFIDFIDQMVGIPSLHRDDCLTRRFFGRSTISSMELKPLVANREFLRSIVPLIATSDIFPIDDTVQYTFPQNIRWQFLPLIDQLGLLPYSDLSITAGKGKYKVNYAASHYCNVPKFETLNHNYGTNRHHLGMTTNKYMVGSNRLVEYLVSMMDKLAHSLGLDARTVTCNLIKTFREDVYIEFFEEGEAFQNHISSNCIPTRFYLDLTMCAIGTRGIVTDVMLNSITPDNY